MEDKELWKVFEETGSVMDYLCYKNACEREEEIESEHYSDRNDTVRNTYR